MISKGLQDVHTKHWTQNSINLNKIAHTNVEWLLTVMKNFGMFPKEVNRNGALDSKICRCATILKILQANKKVVENKNNVA